MSVYCKGRTETGGECDCEEFSPPKVGPLVCAECRHGRSKHKGISSNGDIPREPPTAFSEKKGVMKIFHDISTKKSSGSTAFDLAKKEALRGRAAKSSSTHGQMKVSNIFVGELTWTHNNVRRITGLCMFNL
jgi:hypothetical protein